MVCSDLGFSHKVVNHKTWFKDPNTGIYTNTVKGQNKGIKIGNSHRNRVKKNIRACLHYLVWKMQNKKTCGVRFLGLRDSFK